MYINNKSIKVEKHETILRGDLQHNRTIALLVKGN